MSTNTIYFGENEKTLGFTTLVAKLIKGRISCLYTVQPPYHHCACTARTTVAWAVACVAWRERARALNRLRCGHSARR